MVLISVLNLFVFVFTDEKSEIMISKQMNTIRYQYLVRQCSRCPGDAAFSCATCDCRLCLPCKENHQTDFSTLDHDVMIYNEKDRSISEQENCTDHPHSLCKWYCEFCEVTFCDFCNEHRTHHSTKIKEKVQQKGKIIRSIRSDSLFYSYIILEDIKSDYKIYETKLFNCKSDMQANLLKLYDRIDTAFRRFDFKHRCLNQITKLQKCIKNIYEFEHRLEQLTNEGVKCIRFIKTYRTWTMFYLRLKCHAHLSLTDPLSFKDIKEQFCEITITENEKRSASELKLMYSPKLQTSLTLKHVSGCCHISIETSERVWVSGKDNLIFTNSKGAISYCLKNFNEFCGMHSINKDKKLIYIDDEYNIITLANPMEKEMTCSSIKSFEWKPKCLSYCRSTDDILVGMYNKSKEEGQVLRFSQSGEQTQTIQHDSEGNQLYVKPSYIVENNNFDVVVSITVWTTVNNSSEESSAIVATNFDGKHRFTYKGQDSKIVSRGLCVDALSNIILCDNKTSTVQMLNCNGVFMKHLLIRPPGILKPHGLGYDFKTHCLWVGSHSDKICVYRYLKRRDILTGKSYAFFLMKFIFINTCISVFHYSYMYK